MDDRICSIPECVKPLRARGWCSMHWWRWRQHGDPLALLEKPERAPCSVEACDREARVKGLCKKHYHFLWKYGDPLGKGRPAGDDHPHWVGDGVGYTNAHARTRRRRGNAQGHTCAHCGNPAEQWAFQRDGARVVLTDSKTGFPYSPDPADYIPLCLPCHWRFDRPKE